MLTRLPQQLANLHNALFNCIKLTQLQKYGLSLLHDGHPTINAHLTEEWQHVIQLVITFSFSERV